MKKRLSLIAISSLATLSLFTSISFMAENTAEARRGCCSHHGGVCGCKCCDGTGLSDKCAPYYPSCSASSSTESSYTPPKPKPQRTHNCQTMLTDEVKGTWIFEKPDLKSKILVKLKPAQKIVKFGEQDPKSVFIKVQPVGHKVTGYAHKTVVYCP